MHLEKVTSAAEDRDRAVIGSCRKTADGDTSNQKQESGKLNRPQVTVASSPIDADINVL